MPKKFKLKVRAISLSLNFNNETRYHFTATIPPKVYSSDVGELIGVNTAGQIFALDGLGKALLRLLVQLDLAKKQTVGDADITKELWMVHSPPKKRRMAALLAEVSAVKMEPSAEVSVPSSCIA